MPEPTQSDADQLAISTDDYDRGVRGRQVMFESHTFVALAISRWHGQVLVCTAEYPAPAHVCFVESGREVVHESAD